MSGTKRVLKLAGRPDATVPIGAAETVADGLVTVRVKKALRVEATRGRDHLETLAVHDDDVVAIHLEGGVRMWTSVGLLADDVAAGHAVRGASAAEAVDDGEIVLPTAWPGGQVTRGGGDLLIAGLEVLDIDLPQLSARALARRIDGLGPAHGLHVFDPVRGRLGAALDAAPEGDAPLLVFLHGTGSCTEDSFGALAGSTAARDLAARYGDRILAFEHPTLGASPIDNALALTELLPRGARLHLVSHSRGGLVGELLCRARRGDGEGPFDALDRSLFGADRGQDVDTLDRLDAALRAKAPRVERFVRVACPASGTLLASGRLDRYLSIVLNLLEAVPGFGLNLTYDAFKALVLAVARQRMRPEVLPGIEAMMPTSPLVAMLNRPDVRVDGRLVVVTGDLRGRGFLRRLQAISTNLFYREDHDLVVHTGAMYGGGARADDAGFFLFDQGEEVNHFNYFRRTRSQTALAHGMLTADLVSAPPEGCELRSLTERDPVPGGTGFFDILLGRGDGDGAAATVPDRPVVFLLPGIMGSHLQVGGRRIWMSLDDLAFGRLSRLTIDQPDVSAQAVLQRAYGNLTRFLSSRYEVIPFPYDWRRSLREEAQRLGDAVALVLERTSHPVRLLAHSMGGLLARTMIATRPEVWNQLAERDGGRLVMLGTPNRGSQVITRVLSGRERMVRLLARLDLRHGRKQVLEVVRRFPGLLELLPMHETDPAHEEADPLDYFAPTTWQALATDDDVAEPDAGDLEQARGLEALLDERTLDPERMVYVAGQASATPIRTRMAPDGKRVQFDATARGDGRVTWRTGIPAGIPTYYMAGVVHGQLANHRRSFEAIDELLGTGVTDRLSTVPPAVRTESVFTLRGDDQLDDGPDAVVMYPDAAELEAAAVGGEPASEVAGTDPVRLRVIHGNLVHSPHPVAVGHYQDTDIRAAEGALDRHLGGRLNRLLSFGVYPGGIGEAEITWAEPGVRPAGAVVVGLGQVGRLSAGGLTESFTQGAVRYAVETAEQARENGRTAENGLTLASVLVGSGEGGLAMRDSLGAMLEAVRTANRRLAVREEAEPLRIAELVFVELFEDRAVQAFYTLGRLAEDPRFTERGEPLFVLDQQEGVRADRGGLKRVFAQEDPSWWRRIEITGDQAAERLTKVLDAWWREQVRDLGPSLREAAQALRARYEANRERHLTPLSFTSLADRARAEVLPLGIDRAWADRLIARAVRTVAHDDQLAALFFELLLPSGIKSQAPDKRGLVLVVDKEAAHYPWEMLTDRAGEQPAAPALQSGIVRQLVTSRFRARVESVTRRTAFVVGDPPTYDLEEPPPQHLPRLPNAKREALEVKCLLERAGYRVTARTEDPTPREVLEPLVPPGFRILHLAGHGEVDPAFPERSGMMLQDGLILSPAIVAQMRQVPELVFINCCHLGRIDGVEQTLPFRNQLAANLGMQFIEMGAKAVVAAGWAVEDQAAMAFAKRFYEQMLTGSAFGDAVRQARLAAHEARPTLNTWAAYQCYGDPMFRLAPGAGRRRWTTAYAHRAELITELSNLTVQAADDASGMGPAPARPSRRAQPALVAASRGGDRPGAAAQRAATLRRRRGLLRPGGGVGERRRRAARSRAARQCARPLGRRPGRQGGIAAGAGPRPRRSAPSPTRRRRGATGRSTRCGRRRTITKRRDAGRSRRASSRPASCCASARRSSAWRWSPPATSTRP